MAASAPHPLQIELLVGNIFQHLRLQDVISLRSVCKLWHEIGTKLLVKRIDEIVISFGADLSADKDRRDMTVASFLRMQENCSMNFTNVASYYWDANCGGRLPTADQTINLFEQHGLYIKKVQLNLSGENSWKFLSNVLTTTAPNVEELHLAGHPSDKQLSKILFHHDKPELKLKSIKLSSDEEVEIPIYNAGFLSSLFQASPLLEKLAVNINAKQVGLDRMTSHEHLVVETLASRGHITNLTELSFDAVTGDAFQILATSFKSAPLKKFHATISVIHSNETLENIETFLNDHKLTLTSLYLEFPSDSGGWAKKIEFPKMINLTFLDISEGFPDDIEFSEGPFGIFNFGLQFPKLIELVIGEEAKTKGHRFFKMKNWFPKETIPLLSLRKLTLPPRTDPNIIRRIGRIFPNVVVLHLAVSRPEVLKALWDIWPGLKTLDITMIADKSFDSTSLDSILTGIPDASWATLDTSQVAVGSFPFIGRMKKLRTLAIRGPSPSYPIKPSQRSVGLKITDKTVRLALANLKELGFLCISKKINQITPSCVQQLCRKLDLQQNTSLKALRLVKYEWQK